MDYWKYILKRNRLVCYDDRRIQSCEVEMPGWLRAILRYIPLVGRAVASQTKNPIDDVVVEVGSKIIEDATKNVRCPNAACGATWPEGSLFCGKCGTSLIF